MTLLLILLAIVLGIFSYFFFLFLYIRAKVKKELGSEYEELKPMIKDAWKDMKNLKKEAYSEPKSLGGLTNLLEPRIREDFKDFNKENFFSTMEEDISTYLSALSKKETKRIKKDEDFILLRETILNDIENRIEKEIDEEFDNITFHKHTLKEYKKENGTATIKASTSLSYYYKTNKPDVKVYDDIKRSSIINTEYVYVYDETKFKNNDSHFSLHCPNCGAPLEDLSFHCKYCKSEIVPINLKAWKINKIEIK